MSAVQTIRVLHVVRTLTRGGGVQHWLLECLQRINPEEVQFDLFVLGGQAELDGEFIAHGATVYRATNHRRLLMLFRELRAIIVMGKYDVVHSHCEHFDGIIMWIAAWGGIACRISHSHTDATHCFDRSSLLKKLRLTCLVRMIAYYATHLYAVSNTAGTGLFRQQWARPTGRTHVVHCGTSLELFKGGRQKTADQESDSGQRCLIVGHVGRFIWEKNHAFILEIANTMVNKFGDIKFLLIGDGELREAMLQRTAMMHLSEHVVFTGVRSDVPELLLTTIDVFLFPSHSEGAGLALVEAQAAGIPCIFADTVPDEVNLVPALCHRCSLDDSAEVWASTIWNHRHDKGIVMTQQDAYRIVTQSEFNIAQSVQKLVQMYHLLKSGR